MHPLDDGRYLYGSAHWKHGGHSEPGYEISYSSNEKFNNSRVKSPLLIKLGGSKFEMRVRSILQRQPRECFYTPLQWCSICFPLGYWASRVWKVDWSNARLLKSLEGEMKFTMKIWKGGKMFTVFSIWIHKTRLRFTRDNLEGSQLQMPRWVVCRVVVGSNRQVWFCSKYHYPAWRNWRWLNTGTIWLVSVIYLHSLKVFWNICKNWLTNKIHENKKGIRGSQLCILKPNANSHKLVWRMVGWLVG